MWVVCAVGIAKLSGQKGASNYIQIKKEWKSANV